jgi:FK506-binding protein 1
MGVEKAVLRPGNGIDVPKKHDEVSMEYTGSTTYSCTKTACLTECPGWLYTEEAPDKKGKQ